MSVLGGRVAVVTGASRGIGAATAQALRAAGARVVRVARTLPPGAGFVDLPADLTDAAQVEALAGRVRQEVGRPDVIVSNAGGFLLRPLDQTTIADFDAQVGINLRAAFAVARVFLPMLREAGSGTFVTVGSVADHVGLPENAAYAASKYGLRALHEVLRAELRGSGVRASLVSPGPVDTELWDPIDPDRQPGFTPRAQMLTPGDVADAIRWVLLAPDTVNVDELRLSRS